MSTPDPGGVSGSSHEYVRLARFSATPLFVSNAMAGAALALPRAFSTRHLVVLLAMALVSIGAMYLDDVHGHRDPASTGKGPGTAWGIPAAIVAVSLAMLAFVGPRPLIAGIALVIAIVTYDTWRVGSPGRSILMGLVRALVYVVAFTAFSATVSWILVLWCGIVIAYVAGLTLIPRTVSASGVERYGPLGLVLLPAVVGVISKPADVLVWSLSIAMVLWVAHSVSFAWRSGNRQVGGSVARLIAGISLVDAVVLATREEWWGTLLAMACLALTMMFQRALRAA